MNTDDLILQNRKNALEDYVKSNKTLIMQMQSIISHEFLYLARNHSKITKVALPFTLIRRDVNYLNYIYTKEHVQDIMETYLTTNERLNIKDVIIDVEDEKAYLKIILE